MELNRALAEAMVARGVAEADSRYGRPVCVAVCDQYGFLVAFARMDGTPVRSIQISQGKAYTSARLGVDTHAFGARLLRDHLTPRAFCDERFTEMPGGAVVKDGERVIGGVGISGLLPSEDQAIAELLAVMAP
jgi:glc operon protein GlcG